MLSHIHSVAGLPWCSIQTCLFFYSDLFFTWGISMDLYNFNHSRALFIRFSLPGLRFKSPLRCFQWWPSSMEQSSRSELVHRVIFGEIRYTLPWFDFALWCMSDTYAYQVRMIMVTYAYIYCSLSRVMINWGIWCEDCFSCHACTNCKPWC